MLRGQRAEIVAYYRTRSRDQCQCELGLEWLHDGSTPGMVFLPFTICDAETEVGERVQKWIREVGDQELVA